MYRDVHTSGDETKTAWSQFSASTPLFDYVASCRVKRKAMQV